MLKRQRVIEAWHDRRIGAGEDFADAIDRHVESDDIILLLVSPDFLASDYCYDREMTRAMERQGRGQAIVIPVILRACDWQGAPFGKLNATPPDGKPITQYADRDQAMLEVARLSARRRSGSLRSLRREVFRPPRGRRAPRGSRPSCRGSRCAARAWPTARQEPGVDLPERCSAPCACGS